MKNLNSYHFLKAYVYLIIAILIWGSVPLVIKISSSSKELNINFFNFCRIFITCISLKLMVFLFKIPVSFFYKTKIKIILIGIFTMGVYCHLFTLGVKYTSSSSAGLLSSLVSIWILFLNYITKKSKPSQPSIIGSCISFLGLCLFFYNSLLIDTTDLYGNLLIIFGTFFFALYNIISNKFKDQKINSLVFIYYIFIGTLIYLFTVLIFEYSFNKLDIPERLSVKNIILILYIGIFGSALCYTFYNYSSNILGNYKTSIFINAVPIISLILGINILGEAFSFLQIIASIIILFGIYIVNLSKDGSK